MLKLNYKNYFRFLDFRLAYSIVNLSKQERQIKKKNERQRAVFAFHAIKAITYASIQNGKDINTPSLRDKLIALQINHPYFNYAEQNRRSIIDIFKQGVFLNQSVYNQGRVKDGKETYNPKNSEAFIFCPNLLVTKPMFAQLWKTNRSIMTLGGYGISMTVSIVLFCQLSSIVNKYIYSIFSDQEQMIKLQELRKYQLIQDVPKFFYWNISSSNDQRSIQYIKYSLLQQATELSKDQKGQLENISPNNANIESLNNFLRQLKQFYRLRFIQTKVAIDEINFVTGLMKKWNDFYMQNHIQYKKNFKQLDTLKQKKQVNPNIMNEIEILQKKILKQEKLWQRKEQQYQIPALKIKQIILSLPFLGHYRVFNSSIHIQKDLLLISKDIKYDLLTLSLEGHDKLRRVNIKFNQYLKQQWGLNDFYQYFWFEIEKRLSAKGFSEEKILKLKENFYEKVKTKQLQRKMPKYIRFLNIRQNFQENPSLLNFNSDSSDQLILIKFDKIIESLPIHAYQRCANKITQFIKKGTEQEILQKKEFIQHLFSLALTINEDSTDTEMQFTIQQLETKRTKGQVSKYLLSSHYNHEFLPIKYNESMHFGPNIIFEWTRTQFLSIGLASIFKSLNEINKNKISNEEINTYLLQLTVMAGNIFQHHLIKVLESTGVILKYKIFKQMKGKQQKTIVISGKQKFLHFLPRQSQIKKKEYSKQDLNIKKLNKDYQQEGKNKKYEGKVWINFGNLFKKAEENPGNIYVGFPEQLKIFDKKKQWLFCENNPSIDLVIVKYDRFRKIFFLQSFDVTISFTKKVIEDKINKAKNLFLLISQGNNQQTQFSVDQKIRYPMKQPCNNFQIVHTILCYQQMVQQPIQVSQNPNIAIKFSSIEDLQVIECDNKFALQMFQQIKLLHLNSSDVKNKLHEVYFQRYKK